MAVGVILFPAALAALLESAGGPVGRDLAARAQRVESAAKALAPVDTGRLRGSITYALGRDGAGLFADVGTAVEYAPFLELGTRYMAARPFLVPALRAASG